MEEKSINVPMSYGKRYKVMNFVVLKYTKSLGREDLKALRSELPPDEVRHLQRVGLSYIKVSALSVLWSVEFCALTEMYRMIERTISSGGEEDIAALANLFNMMFMDTSIIGDERYFADKMSAMDSYMKRRKASDVSKEDDDAVLESVKADVDFKDDLDSLSEMENLIKEGGNDDSREENG